MKIKLFLFPSLAGLLVLTSCESEIKRKPSKDYMPDMQTSRAYETYSDHSNLKEKGIHYNNVPVAGTVSRSEEFPNRAEADLPGDTAKYYASSGLVNPITSLTPEEMVEAERQYLINCGICHGAKLDGNGPLWKGGEGPFPAKPATLIGDAKYDAMSAGTMYYSITYGRNLMGSYASQLSPKQRWEIVYFIKNKQAEGKAPAATVAAAP